MGLKLKLELTDEQAIGLIRVAAEMRLSAEDAAMNLINVGLAETEFSTPLSLDDFLQSPPDASSS